MTQDSTTPPREVYELAIEVTPEDIDQLGHVNNVSYVRWVQDAAVAHWTAAAAPEDQARLFWVVIRHEIDYKRPAFLGQKIVARTWVGSATWLAFRRHTDIIRVDDGVVIARAVTTWCPMDVKTGKPKNPGDAVRARFSVSVKSTES